MTTSDRTPPAGTPLERRFQEYSSYLVKNPPPLLLMVLTEALKSAVDVVLITNAQRRGDDDARA